MSNNPSGREPGIDILNWSAHRLGRRKFVGALGGSALVAAVLAACGKGDDDDSAGTEPAGTDAPVTTAAAAETTAGGADTTAGGAATTAAPEGIIGGGGGDGTIKIGWVSPSTGPLASFAAADDFIIAGIEAFLADGLMLGGSSYTVEIIRKDSESVPDTAASVALELINEDQVDLMLVGNTPETTNPVSDQCEANAIPCISSLAPWQPWFIGRGGAPGESQFEWTYHFFWGLEDVIAAFTAMWDQLETNKQVGGLFPNDGDGNAWGDSELGLPKPMAELGYTVVDPGRYENGNQDFTAQINAFKDAGCELVTGVVIPPDFPTFWRQAKQQGFVPKAASIAKAILFPESLQALGDDGIGLTSEVWWSPSHPYSSSLVGVSAQELADAYTADTGKQWTQPIGFAHALFEVAVAALVAAGSAEKEAVRDALPGLKVDTIIGTVDWTSGTPVPNVAKTKLVGGQWRAADTPTGYDLVIVDNTGNPDVPTGGTIEPIA
ncbi:MAG: ABC transporter substrate-binding protein [Acidimicrobiia bacterium]